MTCHRRLSQEFATGRRNILICYSHGYKTLLHRSSQILYYYYRPSYCLKKITVTTGACTYVTTKPSTPIVNVKISRQLKVSLFVGSGSDEHELKNSRHDSRVTDTRVMSPQSQVGNRVTIRTTRQRSIDKLIAATCIFHEIQGVTVNHNERLTHNYHLRGGRKSKPPCLCHNLMKYSTIFRILSLVGYT